MSNAAANRQTIEKFWRDLYARDFDAVGSYFAEDGDDVIVSGRKF